MNKFKELNLKVENLLKEYEIEFQDRLQKKIDQINSKTIHYKYSAKVSFAALKFYKDGVEIYKDLNKVFESLSREYNDVYWKYNYLMKITEVK